MPPSTRRRVSQVSEFQLIKAIARQSPAPNGSSLLKGIGDDAAIIHSLSNANLLVSTDLLVEGIHFDRKLASFHDIGHRAIIANLSDIAAMGGIPQYVLTAVAIPSHYSLSHFRALYRGLLSSCRQHNVRLIGGDTSASRQGLFLGITILGTVERTKALQRSGAKIGDYIYATGTLGDSWAGLNLLQKKSKTPTQRLEKRIAKFLIGRHLRPTPRLDIGRWLSSNRLATAAIDVSDGLSGDLGHLCRESGVGALIEAARIPISSQCTTFARNVNLDPISIALQGGEDYELLFTVPTRQQQTLEGFVKRHGLKVTPIGTVQPRPFGMRIKMEDGSLKKLIQTSYDHFRKRTTHTAN